MAPTWSDLAEERIRGQRGAGTHDDGEAHGAEKEADEREQPKDRGAHDSREVHPPRMLRVLSTIGSTLAVCAREYTTEEPDAHARTRRTQNAHRSAEVTAGARLHDILDVVHCCCTCRPEDCAQTI